MKLPDSIRIEASAGGQSLAGIFVSVEIKTIRKNHFILTFGPTDAVGKITISRDDLMREGEAVHRFFLMDYGHPEADFSGEMVIAALDVDALDRAIKAYELYSSVWDYPPNYLDDIQRSKETLKHLGQATLAIKVEHDGEGIAVKVKTPQM